MLKQDHLKYGAIVAFAVWFVGWSTGLGGSFLPNLIFAILMGVFAAVLFGLVKKYGDKNK